MTPASWPRDNPLKEKLLVLRRSKHTEAQEGLVDALVADLPRFLRPGDLLLVNDAATLPASLMGRLSSGALEIRLLSSHAEAGRFSALAFGDRDWRTPTEDRPAPPLLKVGDHLWFQAGAKTLSAEVQWVSPEYPRLFDLAFVERDAALWEGLYAIGKPVQYSYLERPLSLFHVQTAFGSRPLAMEQPSAGRPLLISLLMTLRKAGIKIATLTHGAGLSSTGDVLLDRRLPLVERYEIPQATVDLVEQTKARGGRVVAVGTTCVRAMEGNMATYGRLRPGPGETDLRIGAGFVPKLIDGLLTGMHEPGQSHFDLISAFIDPDRLEQAHRHAEQHGYLCHEFGDSTLIL